ncbi:MAG: alpha-xylosidase [Candidatus Fimadaptatus sp.]|jgi:alpha-D-xyloside xylohydrolase
MKFTNGYWVVKPEMEMRYATESFAAKLTPERLEVLAPCHHVSGRGATLDGGALTVSFTSPMEGVVRVDIVHNKGAVERGPFFDKNADADVRTSSEQCDEYYSFTSGPLCARVDRKPNGWQVDYIADGRVLTSSGYHGMARALNRETGRVYTMDSLMLDVGECVYGLGERFTALVKNGQTVDMWQGDGGTSSDMAYKNVPFYMTNRGYGIFVDTPSDVSFEVASEKVERVQFSCEGERIAYYVIYGPSPKQVLERYTRLTGRPALPPAWSFGLWLSTSFTTDYDEKTVTSFIQGMADRDIPLRVFHFDCFWMKPFQWCDFIWDDATFPDPVGMIKRLKERGLNICVWINPYIGQYSRLFDEGMERGYLVRKTNGDVWQTDLWQAGMGIVDFTNPDACRWYQGYLKQLLDMGVDCFKTDFGERIPVRDIAWHDGSDPVKMHNYYTFLYNRTVFELLKRERGDGEAVLFARSGTAGGQQFPVHWGGDNTAAYISMAETLRSGLSLAQSGYGFWSHDISGFESTAPADVYKRWCAFGLFSSHSRLHGSSSYRVPWLFGDEASDVLRHFVKLKCRLMPYLYGAAVQAHECGTPMMRPMMLEFPVDPGCDTLDRQYMLGDNLLVAPVFTESGDVDYYLPAGAWTRLNRDEEQVMGGGWKHEVHDFFSLPLMVRENCVIPMGARDDVPDYEYARDVELNLYNIADGARIDVAIPDVKGATASTFTVTRTGDDIHVEANTPYAYTVKIHGSGRLVG